MEGNPEEEVDNEVNYVAHHCVHKKVSTTLKLEVFFNASAKTSNGAFLDDGLMVVKPVLFSHLIRFRVHTIGLSVDKKNVQTIRIRR